MPIASCQNYDAYINTHQFLYSKSHFFMVEQDN